MDLRNSKNDMKQLFTRIVTGALAVAALGCGNITKGQAILYEENFGTPTKNTLVQDYDGWQNSSVTYVGNGTCDVRSTNASTGYECASGGGNVLLNDTVKWFQISGVDLSAANLTARLYCGLRKSTTENGSNLLLEFSTDSIVWIELPLADTLPTGAGTSGWHRVCYPNLPAHPHLHLRFSSLVNAEYRIDDIRILKGDEIEGSKVELPFDISGNSDSTHAEVKSMPGFESHKLGNSYANGSAKFEAKNAGQASLTAHLDSAPELLTFELKGMKGGTPSTYAGILITVSESADNEHWTTVATLSDEDISTSSFTHFGEYLLSADTRHIRWQLSAADTGNTQLNNITISRLAGTDDDDNDEDDTGIESPTALTPAPYPNPATTHLHWNLVRDAHSITLYDLTGRPARQWRNLPNGETLDLTGLAPGLYLLRGTTPAGMVTKKLVIE